MKQKTFTTTLSPDLLQWLGDISKELQVNKNKILESALLAWKREFIRHSIRQSYKNAPKDPEWKALGNMGMEDFLANIQKWGK